MYMYMYIGQTHTLDGSAGIADLTTDESTLVKICALLQLQAKDTDTAVAAVCG